MNRKIIAIAGALVVCVVATFAVASASPGNRTRGVAKLGPWGHSLSSHTAARVQSPAAPQGARTFTVREVQRGSKFVNTDGSDFTTGDYFVFRGDLMRSGHKVGEDHVKCTAAFRVVLCEATASFNGRGGIGHGQIAADGALPARNPSILPITGGTRGFAGVGGQVVIRDVSNNATLLTFQVMR